MMKILFDLITSPLSLFENPIHNNIAMPIIGFIVFKITFAIVGELGLRREAESIAHWIKRFFCFNIYMANLLYCNLVNIIYY